MGSKLSRLAHAGCKQVKKSVGNLAATFMTPLDVDTLLASGGGCGLLHYYWLAAVVPLLLLMLGVASLPALVVNLQSPPVGLADGSKDIWQYIVVQTSLCSTVRASQSHVLPIATVTNAVGFLILWAFCVFFSRRLRIDPRAREWKRRRRQQRLEAKLELERARLRKRQEAKAAKESARREKRAKKKRARDRKKGRKSVQDLVISVNSSGDPASSRAARDEDSTKPITALSQAGLANQMDSGVPRLDSSLHPDTPDRPHRAGVTFPASPDGSDSSDTADTEQMEDNRSKQDPSIHISAGGGRSIALQSWTMLTRPDRLLLAKTVMFRKVPMACIDPEEIVKFASHWGVVDAVSIILGSPRLTALLKRRNRCRAQRSHATLATGVGAVIAGRVAQVSPLVISWHSSLHSTVLGSNEDASPRTLKQLADEKLALAEEELRNEEARGSGVAFVTFASPDQRAACLRDFHSLWGCCSCCPKVHESLILRGITLTAEPAANPRDYIWSNLHVPRYLKLFRRGVTNAASISMIALAWTAGTAIKRGQRSYGLISRAILGTVLLLFGWALQLLFILLGHWELHKQFSSLHLSVMVKSFAATICCGAGVALALDTRREVAHCEWFANVGGIVLYAALVSVLAQPVLQYLSPFARVKNMYLQHVSPYYAGHEEVEGLSVAPVLDAAPTLAPEDATSTPTLLSVNDSVAALMKKPKMDFSLHHSYARLLCTFHLTVWFGPLMPLIYFLGALNLALTYLVEKYHFLHSYTHPICYDDQMSLVVGQLLFMSIVIQQLLCLLLHIALGLNPFHWIFPSIFMGLAFLPVASKYFTRCWSWFWCTRVCSDRKGEGAELLLEGETVEEGEETVTFVPSEVFLHRSYCRHLSAHPK